MKILKFTKQGCGPCGAMGSFLIQNKVSTEAYDIGTEDGMKKAEEYGVMNVPTLVFVDDEGKELDRAVGFNSMMAGAILKAITDLK
jgi:thioredoxin 1